MLNLHWSHAALSWSLLKCLQNKIIPIFYSDLFLDAEESETPSVQQASNPSPCPRTPSPCYDSINPSPLRSTFPEVCKSQKYDRLEKRRTSDESETRQLLGASVHGSSSVEEVVSGSTESTSSLGSVCETTCPETVEVAQSSSKQLKQK